ncbi:hypothetical protein AB0O90_17240 [Microbacterium testaceum]|uniref:hypothetical protein n=1 Tax=Microbacterium testaceum TaxID=2033 RepID=UPI0034472F71
MAIKKRTTTGKERTPEEAAAIEAFGAAADTPPAPTRPAPATQARQAPAAPRRSAAAPEWPEGVSKTLLIRYPDAELAIELADVAALEDRSQHKTAVRALQRGLEILRAEHRG